MFVENRTLRQKQNLNGLGRFKLRKAIGKVFQTTAHVLTLNTGTKKNFQKLTKIATFPIVAPTKLVTKGLTRLMPMPRGPVDVPVDDGSLVVSADPYVNQMSPDYQRYPVAAQSDYFPAPQLPPQDGQYLNPDMTQAGAPPGAAPAVDKKKVLLYGGLGAAVLWFLLKRKG